MKRKIGERWAAGATNLGALKNAYKRAGDNILFFSKEEGSTKYIAIPLYSIYLVFFTIVPLYPILASLQEAQHMKEPIIEEVILNDD